MIHLKNRNAMPVEHDSDRRRSTGRNTRRELLCKAGLAGLGAFATSLLLPEDEVYAKPPPPMHIPSGMAIIAADAPVGAQAQGMVGRSNVVGLVILFAPGSPPDYFVMIDDPEGSLVGSPYDPIPFSLKQDQVIYHQLFSPARATLSSNVTFSLLDADHKVLATQTLRILGT